MEYVTTLQNVIAQPFMLRALTGGLVVAVVASIVGVFVTLRKESFISDGVAHASIAGVALGFVLSGQPLIFALIVGALMAAIVVFIKHSTDLSLDSTIGISYPALFAIGVITIYASGRYAPELESFIFGNILAINTMDILSAALIALAVFVFMSLKINELLYATFDRDAAIVKGINVIALDYVFTILTALVVIVSVKLVGVVLVTALLVTPAAHARLFARNFASMIPFAIIHAVASVLIGILLSLYLPPGPMIVIVSTLLLLLGVIFKKLNPGI